MTNLFKVETDNYSKWYFCPQHCHKHNRIVSVFLTVTTTCNTGQNLSLFIHLVHNGGRMSLFNTRNQTMYSVVKLVLWVRAVGSQM